MVYKFFDKKSKGICITTLANKSVSQNQQLAEELHKPIIREFEKRKVHSVFKDNIWCANLADMLFFSKYAWVVPLKDKKGASIVAGFQSILKQSNRKPNKIWVDKGSKFYNTSFKKWLQDNDIVMYSTHNEGKSVVTERFIRTIKSKIYNYITSISKNVYIDKLDDIVNEYNNTYQTTIKIKPLDVKDNTYDKDLKFKVGDHVRISKYKNIFAKG